MKENNPGEKPFHDDGFTIIEIVIVMILIMVAIWPMGRVIASAMEASSDEQYLTQCAFLAQLKMEEVRYKSHCYSDNAQCTALAGSDALDWGAGIGVSGHNEGPGACTFHNGFDNYKCEVIDDLITPIGQCRAQARCLKAVRVTVWYDKNGDNIWNSAVEPRVKLESYLTARAPMPRTGL